MSDVGTVIDDGSLRLEFLITGATSGGELHEMRATYMPDSPLAVAHVHPAQDEHFEVLEGELLFVVDGNERRVSAGETIDIPRGSVHQVRNPGDGPAVTIWQTRPALRTGEFLEAAAAARADGDLDTLLEVVAAYGDVFVLADQPDG
jgi:mannose-6-phosphate isomerase-like protein (cupin superfamily)